MPPPRPRNSANNTSSSTGRPLPSAPMSERQQMALLMQMTSSASPSSSSVADINSSTNVPSHCPARSRDRNERGETALHVAAIKGDQDGVKKLIESGMSPNIEDFAGWTPLHEACNHSHYNVALVLVKAGANVNAKGLDDDTPLHDAAVVGNLKLVKMLVEKGADVYMKNRKGKTPIDVASSTVSPYLLSLRDSMLSSSRSPQVKKSLLIDQKKGSDESEESVNTSILINHLSANKEEMESYDFKSLSTENTEDKQDLRNSEKIVASTCDEKPSDDKVAPHQTAGLSTSATVSQSKRSYSDVETSEESNEVEESKRKKRKDSETNKDNYKMNATNRVPIRQEKTTKPSNFPTKSSSSTICKSNTNIDRKSPCESPKLVCKLNDSDVETDDSKSVDNFGNGGPKVPPLKIVIPQQNAVNDNDGNTRNGKSNSTRSHQALPYVVASSNSNDCVEKDSALSLSLSRCSSPAEGLLKTGANNSLSDEKFGKASSEERAQQRVLRSSHRSGGQNNDRSSNNSSPQMQSNSPSPAQAPPNETVETRLEITNKNVSSPSVQLTAPLESEVSGNVPSPSTSSNSSSKEPNQTAVELHPRKRKIRAKQDETGNKPNNAPVQVSNDPTSNQNEIHPHDHPFTNCYQMYLNIRKQIEKKHKTLIPIQPRPPQCFKDYLMNRRTYILASKTATESVIAFPIGLPSQLKDIFMSQEQERHKLKMQHIVEKEKLGLTVEQEILRVHAKAARSLACQLLPYSVCTVLKDEEIYNLITPEQEEKDRNARSRYNGRLFLSWLQDVDDKWEKIKEAMVLRHHNEAESLHAVQKMDWEWVMKENGLCDFKSQPDIDEKHVPMVHVSDDFDLLPA